MRKLLILVGTPLLLLAAGSLMMDMQTSAPGDQPRRGDSQSAPRYTIRNAEWTRLGSNGKTEFRINADRIDYYDDESARMTVPKVAQVRTEASTRFVFRRAAANLVCQSSAQ